MLSHPRGVSVQLLYPPSIVEVDTVVYVNEVDTDVAVVPLLEACVVLPELDMVVSNCEDAIVFVPVDLLVGLMEGLNDGSILGEADEETAVEESGLCSVVSTTEDECELDVILEVVLVCDSD